MIKPCQVVHPTPEEMAKAKSKLFEVYKGITPESQFWMMQKMNIDMSSEEKLERPDKVLVERSLQSIYRFRSSERVYRSNDILSVIDQMMRGKDLNRN